MTTPRRDVLRLAGAGGASLIFGTAANAESSHGLNAALVSDWVAWPSLDAAGIGPGLNELRQTLYTLPTTSMVIVRGGKIAWTYGDITQVSYVASARKSILSILYGSQVLNGVIELDSTLAELGIDDIDALLPIEKTATVRQILTATSGVYHPSEQSGRRRGSPGPWVCKARQSVLLQQLGFQRRRSDLRKTHRTDGVPSLRG